MKIAIAGAGIGGLTAAMCLHRAGFDVEVFEAVSELKPLGGAIEDHLQLAAMDRELRPRQAGMAAARIGPDRLAMPVGVAQLARLDGGGGQRRLQAEARQDTHGARLDVDADAERF